MHCMRTSVDFFGLAVQSLHNALCFPLVPILTLDPAGWSKEDGSFAVELRLYQCPPAYEWISEWMIDMNGPVDAEGWMYADQFYTDTTLYQAQMNDAHHVRRRRWIRMRRNITTPLKQEPTTPRDIESIISQMRSKRMDRERLEALAKWLKLGTLKPALVSLFKTGTLDHGRVGS
ncbi:hypothetical protein EDD86DRAFT_127351 [Gorgonomyces haynaldii]|nr:hypothetical protein EDD86DRAFT_127351 [Gorgonomyces haynaldii]